MILNENGKIVCAILYDFPQHYVNIELDVFVVMPNHIHCVILIIDNDEGAGFKPAPSSNLLFVLLGATQISGS
jgi:REP element-mobilizing transposase RayT